MAAAKISEDDAERRLISTASGPSHATPAFVSAPTETWPLALRCWTTGPLSMNMPVSSIASPIEPPPLLRRSINTPSTLSFFICSSRRATSRVALR